MISRLVASWVQRSFVRVDQRTQEAQDENHEKKDEDIDGSIVILGRVETLHAHLYQSGGKIDVTGKEQIVSGRQRQRQTRVSL